MDKALHLLRKAGYDVNIERGRLYYRTSEGGVVAVATEHEVAHLGRVAARE